MYVRAMCFIFSVYVVVFSLYLFLSMYFLNFLITSPLRPSISSLSILYFHLPSVACVRVQLHSL